MGKLIFLVMLLVGCGKIEYQVKVKEQTITDMGKVIDVWGCTRTGYDNNTIMCNVETDTHKISNLYITALKHPYINNGDHIKTKTITYEKVKDVDLYLCVNDLCSLYSHMVNRGI